MTELNEIIDAVEEQEVSGTKRQLLQSLNPVRSALSSKVLVLDDAPYLQLFNHNQGLWYGVRTSTVDFFIPVLSQSELQQPVNIDYGRLDRILRELTDNVRITEVDNQIMVWDEHAKVRLTNYSVEESLLVDTEQLQGKITRVQEEGHTVDKKELIKVLSMLNKVSTDEGADIYDFVGSLSFTENETYLVSSKYIVTTAHKNPFSFMLSSTESSVLHTFLTATDGEVKMLQTDNNEVHVVSGDSILVLMEVETNTPLTQLQRITLFEKQESVTVEINELLRYLRLSTIFMDKYGEDIDCIVEDGVGTIGEDNPDTGGSKGYFDATGVSDFSIKIAAFDLLKILNNLPSTEENFTLEVNLDTEEAYFKQGDVECLMAIYVE